MLSQFLFSELNAHATGSSSSSSLSSGSEAEFHTSCGKSPNLFDEILLFTVEQVPLPTPANL